MIDWLLTQDRALYLLLAHEWRLTALDSLMLFVTNKWNLVVPGLLLLGAWLARGRRKHKLWLVLLGVVLIATTDVGATALKKVFVRPRPCVEIAGALLGCTDTPSFPSNHAANFFALATYLAVVAPTTRWPWLAFATLVAFSRVHVGVHYPLDIVAGAVFGATLGFVAAGCARLYRAPVERRQGDSAQIRGAASPPPSGDRAIGTSAPADCATPPR